VEVSGLTSRSPEGFMMDVVLGAVAPGHIQG
jgi:hypothetical protein